VDPKGVDRVQRACSRATDSTELLEVLGDEIRTLVPFDASMIFGVDPATMLAVAPSRVEALDSGYCDIFWHGEFHEQDANQFRDLARSATPAAALHVATGGVPTRSPRYRDYVVPQGFDDELRAVFRTGDATWAMAGFYRDKGRSRFTEDDVALLAAISDVAGSAMRTYVTAAAAGRGPATAAPGLLLFDCNGVLVSANEEAARWMSDIYGAPDSIDRTWVDVLADVSTDDLTIPFPVIPLLLRARAVAAGREPGPARLRFRDLHGRWVVLHASCLASNGGCDGGVAVVVEPAKSGEIAPIIIQAYGLSPREQDIVRAIARGASTADIAAELFLSVHTVRDYIKTVFEKVGVSSRGELVASLFAEHYTDALHATLVHA
jgi:DNA-binding CsgD family transcriptional regulator